MAEYEKSKVDHFIGCEQCLEPGKRIEDSDCVAVYEDGSMYCFKGSHPIKEETSKIEVTFGSINTVEFPIKGDYISLTKRNLRYDTCERYHIQVGQYRNKPVQIFNYFHKNELIAQKLKYEDKSFEWIGNTKFPEMFGMHLQGKGKHLAITEGELDAAALSQALDNQWPVFSLKNGAGGAVDDIKNNLKTLNEFERIVLMFDMDEPGQKAVQAIAKLPALIGKISIAHLPLKDANEMLIEGRTDELKQAFWSAVPYRPDGLVDPTERTRRLFENRTVTDFTYPYPLLNQLTYGARKGEIVLLTGGSGLGKSTLAREIGYELIKAKQRVLFITLEESATFTDECLLGMEVNKLLRINGDSLSEEYKQIFEEKIRPFTEMYDDQGNMTPQQLQLVVEYAALASNCHWIIFDHVSMASLPDTGALNTERGFIDTNMTNLRKVTQRLQIGVFVISHLVKPKDGAGFEEGRPVTLQDLRGSGTLYTIPNIIIAMEGNMYDGTQERKIKVLKNRFIGKVGKADTLKYDPNIGRLHLLDNLTQDIV